MDANKIDMFFVANGKKLPSEKAVLIFLVIRGKLWTI